MSLATPSSTRTLTTLWVSIAISGMLNGCGGEHWSRDAQDLSVDTVQGLIVVQNPREGQWKPSERWKVVEEFRWGDTSGVAGEGLVNDLTTVTFGPNGQVFVLEYSGQDIVVLDVNSIIPPQWHGTVTPAFGWRIAGTADIRCSIRWGVI